jgi:hypothetical protein
MMDGRLTSRPVRTALVLLMVFGAGVAVGPQVRLLYWTAVLDWHPSGWQKDLAAMRLGAYGPRGQMVLYRHIASPDEDISLCVVTELVNEDKGPQQLFDAYLWLPDGYVREKLLVLDSIDRHARQVHGHLIELLCTDLSHFEPQPQVQAKIRQVLRSYAAVNAAETCQRMGVSLAGESAGQ